MSQIRSAGWGFPLSLAVLILYFHLGFRESCTVVRGIGVLLAGGVFVASLKWRWESRLPVCRSRNESVFFSAASFLFLAGQLSLFTFPDKILRLGSELGWNGTPYDSLPKYLYATVIFFLGAAAWYAVKRLLLLVWRYLEEPLTGLWHSLDRFDAVLFTLGILVGGTFTIWTFYTTNVFYYPCRMAGEAPVFNVIFTSDSGLLAQQCSYVNLFSGENDFRQMLFALYSLPLYLFHLSVCFLPPESFFRGIAYALPQLAFLQGSFLILVRLLRLERWDKVVFFFFANCTFPAMLFTLLQEQYVIAVFFLLLYLLLRQDRNAGVLLAGAGGTLTTSGAALFLAPGISWKERGKTFVQAALFGGSAMLLTAKWGIIVTLFKQVRLYTSFTGQTVTWGEKLEQYLQFLAGCFIAPRVTEIGDSLQLAPPSGRIPWAGVFVVILLLCGFLFNRRDDRALLSFNWMLFSLFLLLLIGWGSPENGMILYSLYFQWAFSALVWLLAEKILNRRRTALRLTILAAAVGMLWFNLPALYSLWSWGVVHYPAF